MPHQKKTELLLSILEAQPVIPVIRIGDLSRAAPLARALAAGGLPAIEITLRTPEALDAIRLVIDEVPEAIVGAGTVLAARQYDKVAGAGAKFVVSPMVGTFYLAASPDAPPFAKVGDQVGPASVVCIIEAMKVFNEIPAECSGKITAVLVENGDAVEFGQKLFRVE